MAAKVDNSVLQDGFSLYHHIIAFDDEGNWTYGTTGNESHL